MERFRSLRDLRLMDGFSLSPLPEIPSGLKTKRPQQTIIPGGKNFLGLHVWEDNKVSS
ncbi:hypothetical protein [Azotobacter chroococcum]|uniref:Uncharacterized protein n=1 Tax=Azotobacter chroococcum TaxID=353 RepID=A0AAQ0C1G7_9GAMM|nr:hypothetical protein [Azotobacter chroococcum]QQE91064.1 hypothetical protein GKQ51_22900 [Azotobacter chroococcum]